MPVGHLGVKYSSDVVPQRDSSRYDSNSSSSLSSFSSSHYGSGALSASAASLGAAVGGGVTVAFSSGAATGKQVFSLESGEGCLNNNFSSSPTSLIGQQPAKTVLLVKCTDTSINAFNQAIATQRKHNVSTASITFKPGGGLINVPVDIGNGNAEISGLEFKTSKMENVLQCILQPKKISHNRLINMGEISQQVRINATDEIFQQTKMKMNQVEEDSKKISTKTLDDGFGKNKLGGISKRKTMTEKPKLMAEAAALAKPTLSANKFQQRGGSSSSHLHSTSSSSVRNLSGRVQSASSSPTNESSEPIASICNGMSSSSRLGAASLLPPPNGSSILSASSSALSCTSLSPSRFSASAVREAKLQNGMAATASIYSHSSNSSSPLHNQSTPSSYAMIGSNNSSRSSSPLLGLLQPSLASSGGAPGSGFGEVGLPAVELESSSPLSQDIPIHSKNNGAVERSQTTNKSISQFKHNPRNDKIQQPRQNRTDPMAAAFSPPKLPSSSSSSKFQASQAAASNGSSGGDGTTTSSISLPNSTNTSSHTNSSPNSYGLKDHIVHLLALVDEGGMSVSSLTFRLKSHCKLPSVQYQNVMSALNQVAQPNKNREPVTYSLKSPSHIIPQIIKPHLYPHYSPAQRQQMQQKIESITASLPDSMVMGNKPSEDVSVTSSVMLSLGPPSSGTDEEMLDSSHPTPSSTSCFAQGVRNSSMGLKAAHNSDSASRVMANSAEAVSEPPNMPGHAMRSNQSTDIERLKDSSKKSQRKRLEPDSGHNDARIKRKHPRQQGVFASGNGVASSRGVANDCNNDPKPFRANQSPERRPTVEHSLMHQTLEVPSQNGDCVQSSRLSLLNGRNGAPTCTPVYDDDDSPSSSMREDQEELPIEEDERKICDESRVEASDKMTSPMIDIVQSHEHDGGHRHQSYAMAASEDDKEMQSFASCMTNCTYCLEDPLKDFCLLKSEFPPIDSRHEYYQLVEHFKREYYGEFLPLRKKVTETKKTFKQLKHDFDAAKLQYCKVDDPGNKKQLEQLARNVIKVHEDLMRRENFLKTNHNCNQFHNRLSVMMTRLKDFRDKELALSAVAAMEIYGNQPMTSSTGEQTKKLIGSNRQAMESSAAPSAGAMSHREQKSYTSSTGKQHSGHNSRHSDMHVMTGSSENKRKERSVAASASVN